MTLDLQVCLQARLSRDPRFDGKFFIGVRSTRIYCRSVCPVPTVKEKNVRYFPTAAAAAEAGFRPCLRCRPESSPGTPAWHGTSATVSRALRLIAESGLENRGMESLAERLGVGSRHLRRLFIRYLGAPPSTIAHTRRLHFAKKLLDETDLSMTNVAQASGFGCVRRFNAAFRSTYDRTPTEIRRLTRQNRVDSPNQYVFQLRFRPPYDWKGILKLLGAQAIPGVERVDGESYSRTIAIEGLRGHFRITLAGQHTLLTRVQIGDPRLLYRVIERVRKMFDLNADWTAIAEVLGRDPELATRIGAQPGLRLAGCWNGFELATRTVLGQEVGASRANVLAGHMASAFGQRVSGGHGVSSLFPSAEVLADARLSSLGLTKKRAETIRKLARAVSDGQIRFEAFASSNALYLSLREIPGIGRWTAQYVAMRTLGDPDTLLRLNSRLVRAMHLGGEAEVKKRAERWRPWRSYASLYLWSTDEIEG
jgi:AraC family transcriptional regulator, regulatory protein of adaptative response / DNA-3-methyladenine glycosylase II